MFKLIHVDIENAARIEFTLHTDSTLSEMCEGFESFLRANSYHFDGSVQIVDSEMQLELPLGGMEQNANIWERSGRRLNDATSEEWDDAAIAQSFAAAKKNNDALDSLQINKEYVK
tara:strand:+ start:575 stop:922 length:348 start_codon:yes stop_codon:yes gene_type:complete